MTAPAQPQPATGITVVQLAAIAELGDEGKALLGPEVGPRQFVAALVAAEQYPDAVRFLAHCIPRREAVWWAWACARRTAGAAPPPAIKGALDATERWISQPSEENRRAAMAAAQVAELSTAAGCAGLAAFFSAGSLAPPDAPVVAPGPWMTAKAVAGAVIIAAVSSEPELAPEKFQAFIKHGLEVVNRLGMWPQ